jgi:hypothetical protein
MNYCVTDGLILSWWAMMRSNLCMIILKWYDIQTHRGLVTIIIHIYCESYLCYNCGWFISFFNKNSMQWSTEVDSVILFEIGHIMIYIWVWHLTYISLCFDVTGSGRGSYNDLNCCDIIMIWVCFTQTKLVLQV